MITLRNAAWKVYIEIIYLKAVKTEKTIVPPEEYSRGEFAQSAAMIMESRMAINPMVKSG